MFEVASLMDIVYFYRRSKFDDAEILFSLRSVAAYAPWVRKVWVFGDCPWFLADDAAMIEHVPHEYVARAGDFRTPVTNYFLMLFLSSLIPELSFEYLVFSDDYILLDHLSEEEARKDRFLENLDNTEVRGRGAWKDALWRTYDLLKRLGYPGYNFETHTPTYFNKKRVLEAYCEFKDSVSQDRFQGMLGPTAVLNHAHRKEGGLQLSSIIDTGVRAGFYGSPPIYEHVERQCAGRLFLNFDDGAFGPDLVRFLRQRFRSPCKFENPAKIKTRKQRPSPPGS